MHMISSGLLRFLTGTLMCVTVMCPFAAWAQHEVFVNINGELKQPACTPNLQGQMVSGNAVSLPDVYTDDLNAQNKVYGNVTLHFRASGCTGNVNNMWVHFTSANVDGNGRIIPNNSSSLRFEILNDNVNGTLIRVGGSAANSPNSNQGTAVLFSGADPLTNPDRVADKYYGIRYYAQAAVPARDYSASVTANFKYY